MEGIIRFFRSADARSFTALWENVFGDSEEYVARYLAHVNPYSDILVYSTGGVVRAELSMLRAQVVIAGEAYPARYIYAVATDPAYRGRGIASDLLKRAHEIMRVRGEAVATLVPAEESLFGYYRARGYEDAFYIDEIDIMERDIPVPSLGYIIEPCSSDEYYIARERAFGAKYPYLRWDVGMVKYAIDILNGGMLKLSLGDNHASALWEYDSDQHNNILIRELASDGMDFTTAIAIIHVQLQANSYSARLAVGSGGNKRAFGMLYKVDDIVCGSDGYLGLALD